MSDPVAPEARATLAAPEAPVTTAPGRAGPEALTAPKSPTTEDQPMTSAQVRPVPDLTALARKAAALDAADGLAPVRELFTVDPGTVYLDGNSLGALPRHVPARMQEVITREWGALGIRSWEESGWWTAPERIGDRIAPLVGAAPGTVVVGDSTSVNVFKALVAAVRMAGDDRDEILVDATTFPTDGYIAGSAARMTGRRIVPYTPGDPVGPRTAAALVNHVDYRTGRLHDLPAVTAAVHAAGAKVVWDLCHSAGALPVGLGAHGADFAVGCTYKYLNGGPGSPAFLYVRPDLQASFDSPLPGWTSHEEPFGMKPAYTPADGAPRGRVGTPDILSMLALESALDVWDGVTVEAVRAKSLALTDFFLECVSLESVTPAAPGQRGSQVSLRCEDAGAVMKQLIARGVVGDFRPPDILRFGFTPLYVGFGDALRAARVLAEVLA